MRAIDADAVTAWMIRELRKGPNGAFDALNGRQAANLIGKTIDKAPTIEGEIWLGADKRPKKPGKYLVYGVTMFVPDHNREPCGHWEIKTANWSDKWGWECKVKCWRPLPAAPTEGDK